jgi:hypothetical protein
MVNMGTYLINKQETYYRGRAFHPTIDLLLQFSTTGHPQVTTMNP